ncbi:MAG TPA: hypothetical protein VGE01_13800, partial [Fimbriimonas sp.]
MNLITTLLLLVIVAVASADWNADWRKKNPIWRGVHIGVGNDASLEALGRQVPAMARQGLNALVVEVDYSYQFKSRPEMNDPNGISHKGARNFTRLCRENGVRVIPQINCFGHQSWAENTGALLTKHPELDESPGMYPGNKDI